MPPPPADAPVEDAGPANDGTTDLPQTTGGDDGPDQTWHRGLYLFAGGGRKGDMRDWLTKIAGARNMKIDLTEIDIVRGKKSNNLLNKVVRNSLWKRVVDEKFDFILASPPCSSFSRARKAHDKGPPPLRSTRYPRGFPWLKGAALQTVKDSNLLVDFTAAVLRKQASRGGIVLLEHPEDLGRAKHHASAAVAPASIWKLPQISSLTTIQGGGWGALYQEDHGVVYRKPTRILTNLVKSETFLELGPPKFDNSGYYLGPLTARPFRPHLTGRETDGTFRTSKSAAWPSGLCRTIADLICEHLWTKFPVEGAKGAKAKSAARPSTLGSSSPSSSTPTSASSLSGGRASASSDLCADPAPGGVGNVPARGEVWEPTPPPITQPVGEVAASASGSASASACSVSSTSMASCAPSSDVTMTKTTRRKVTQVEIDKVRQGLLDPSVVYIGRVPGPSGRPSKWANPFRIGQHGDREKVVDQYCRLVAPQFGKGELEQLRGKTLLCHCSPDQMCHGDVLVELVDLHFPKPKKVTWDDDPTLPHFRGTRGDEEPLLDYIDDGLPTRIVPENLAGQHEDATENMIGAPAPEYGPENLERPEWPHLPKGPQRKAAFMGKPKPYEDGGGLCSPGRWEAKFRQPPSPAAAGILGKARELFAESVRKSSGGLDTPLGLMLKLAAGRFDESPLDGDVVSEMTRHIGRTTGTSEEDQGIAPGQAFRLRLVRNLLELLGDPDYNYFGELEEGVPIGVGVEMPRTPLVFEEKVKWSLTEEIDDVQHEVLNYKSTKGHEKEVEMLFREEAGLGWMVEMDDDKAKEEYGGDLHIAGLGVVEEKDKIRVVHDGSHGIQVNHRIRVRDQTRSPTAGEIRTLMRERDDQKQLIIVGDVSKAHRRVKIRRQDWGFQACRLVPGKVWLNTVGTYGIASAGYWWQRLAAALVVRMFYYFMAASGSQDALLFADDLLMTAGRVAEIVDLGALLLIWAALGVPWKWKKFRGGQQVQWIGYWIDMDAFRIGISDGRAAWLCKWMTDTVNKGIVEVADLRAVLGRLSFSLGALEYLRPFVAPLFSWCAAVDSMPRAPLPWSVSFILKFLTEEIQGEGRTQIVRPIRALDGPVFRADAKAEGQQVVIGGWECRGGLPPCFGPMVPA